MRSGVRVQASMGEPTPWHSRAKARSRRSATRAERALAMAYALDKAIESGRYRSASDAAKALGVTGAQVSHVLLLRLLPIDVQEDVLSGLERRAPRELRAVFRWMLRVR